MKYVPRIQGYKVEYTRHHIFDKHKKAYFKYELFIHP